MNKCSGCKIEKPELEFWKHRSHKDGLQDYCKVCWSAYGKGRKEKENEYRMKSGRGQNRKRQDYLRSWAMKKRYGITIDQYNQKLIDQKGLCSICEKGHSEVHNGLYVDHDHSSKQVRDLLCRECNSGIGFFSENPDLLVRASEYLKRHKVQKLHFIKGDL